MKLTKYEHACLTLEKNGQFLVVDPGNISDDFVTPENVVAIVLTHEHPDHVDESKIQAIIESNPGVLIVSHQGIINSHSWPSTRVVQPGDSITVGEFTLQFFGGKHAVIHSSLPIVDNLGVMINDTLYYPGDSYAVPDVPVKILAVPTSGPWLKIGDVVDFIIDVKPELAFSTHDAHSSQKNMELVDRMIPMLIPNTIHYVRLSDSIDI